MFILVNLILPPPLSRRVRLSKRIVDILKVNLLMNFRSLGRAFIVLLRVQGPAEQIVQIDDELALGEADQKPEGGGLLFEAVVREDCGGGESG